MNFFERQQVARRNTRVMIILFGLAVVGIVLAVDFVSAVVWITQNPEAIVRRPGQSLAGASLAAVPAWVYGLATLGTIGAIAGVSLYEAAKLRAGGGVAVAQMMGARHVDPGTTELLERRLLNVVEEMAIAAGTRVPHVFVMDGEKGINAFAAGYTSANTVIAVTRGTLESLNRDELQAVVGHEFSHIVNGDMAMNIRMIGVLAGIVFIGAVGGFLLRSMRKGSGKGKGPILLLGVGLFVIGYVGLFFARLIKAAVARQREFLADAASVQFTRNPDGLAGALDQIRASPASSLVAHRHAEDVSHLFFGQAIGIGLAGLFATHPPLEERIRRISPRFRMAEYREKRPPVAQALTAAPEAAMGFALAEPAAGPGGAREGDVARPWTRSPAESVELVGSLDARGIAGVRHALESIPAGVRERLREPHGAAAAVVALLLAPPEAVTAAQVEAARAAGAGALADAAAAASAELRSLGPAYYLSLVDLALPALKQAPEDERKRLLDALHAVIHADRRVSMFEFALSTLMRSQLFPPPVSLRPRYRGLEEVRVEVLFALSLVANAGAGRGPQAEAAVQAAFAAGARALGWSDARPVARAAIGMEEAGQVFDKLAALAPMPKAVLVKALFATVTCDGSIRIIEAAMMRMVGAVLDCPLPPLLETLDPRSLAV